MEEKNAGLIQAGDKKVEGVASCCHPLPHRVTGERDSDSSHMSTGKRQEAMSTVCNREDFGWTYRKNSSHKSGTSDAPERW